MPLTKLPRDAGWPCPARHPKWQLRLSQLVQHGGETVPEATDWVVEERIRWRRPPLREDVPYSIFILAIKSFTNVPDRHCSQVPSGAIGPNRGMLSKTPLPESSRVPRTIERLPPSGVGPEAGCGLRWGNSLLVRDAAKIVIVSEYKHTGIAHRHENMVKTLSAATEWLNLVGKVPVQGRPPGITS